MTTTTPLPCKFCGEPNDLTCSCVAALPQLPDLPPQLTQLVGALQAGYYVIDGREATTTPPRS